MADPPTSPKETSPALYRYLIMLIGFVTLAGASGVSSPFLSSTDPAPGVRLEPCRRGQRLFGQPTGARRQRPVDGRTAGPLRPALVISKRRDMVGVAWMACGTLDTLGQFILFYGVLSALGQTALSLATVVVVALVSADAPWPGDRLGGCRHGVGHVLFVPGAAWLITTVGWRWAFMIVGATVLAVLVPLNLLHRPMPALGAPSLSAATLHGALRTRALWMLCLAHLCMTITMTMVNVHLVNFLVGTGMLLHRRRLDGVQCAQPGEPGRANVFRVVGRPLKGEGAFTVALSCTMTGYVMLLLLGALETRWPLYAFIVSYGFAQGAGGIAIAAKTVEVFHGPRLGTIFMVVTLSGNLGAAFGAWIGGRFFDLTGSYALTFATAIASGLLAIGCMWAGRSRSPVPSPAWRGVG